MFTFKIFAKNHLVLFRQWLKADHVKDFWQEPEDDQKLEKKFLEELPRLELSTFGAEGALQQWR